MKLDFNKQIYEDQLPEMTDKEYDVWYENSNVINGVRMGFNPEELHTEILV